MFACLNAVYCSNEYNWMSYMYGINHKMEAKKGDL